MQARLNPWLLVLAASPALLAAALCISWARGGMLPLRGDEPHYILMAVSLLEDGDLLLQNNYDIECVAHEFYGCVEPHVFRLERGWVPYHQPGVSALVALPYRAGHVLGARLAMIALAALLPVLLLIWLTREAGPAAAPWLTAASTLSTPFLFGASALYPDLIAGVIVFGLTIWVLHDEDRRPIVLRAALWTVCGALCWLNVKFVAATAVIVAWRLFRTRRLPAEAALVLAGPLTLAAFHYWGFGTVLGGRGGSELTSSPLRALLFFLGLHLDQGQGLFFQNPLWLAGLPAFVVWARRDPVNAAFWLLLYLSLIAPNSLQMGRYGGEGPAGRYGWTAGWLWLIPIARSGLAARAAGALAAAALIYQAVLAMRWLPNPRVLMPVLSEELSDRNSLFPVGWRWWAPSFYDWSYASYLTYPPNVIAIATIVVLIAGGLIVARPPKKWFVTGVPDGRSSRGFGRDSD